MTIIPIFIHVKEKTDKEVQEEWERRAYWRKREEEREARERKRRADEKRRKHEEKRRKREEFNAWYFDLKMNNEWETQILPEGWSIFGQGFFGVLKEYSKSDFEQETI